MISKQNTLNRRSGQLHQPVGVEDISKLVLDPKDLSSIISGVSAVSGVSGISGISSNEDDSNDEDEEEYEQDIEQRAFVNKTLQQGTTPRGRRGVVIAENLKAANKGQGRRAGGIDLTQSARLPSKISTLKTDENSSDSDSSDSKEEQSNKKPTVASKKRQKTGRDKRYKSLVTTAADQLSMLHKIQEMDQGESDSSNSTSSDSDSAFDERINKIESKLGTAVDSRLKLRTAFRAKIYQISGPVALVELNEDFKLSQQQGLLLAEQLLQSFDSEDDNQGRKILKFEELEQVQNQLYVKEKNRYYGKPNCIQLFRHQSGTLAFIGNSSGYIQVFNVGTQKQHRPLFEPSLSHNGVTCIDITDDGHYLIGGHQKGTISLWDCSRMRLVHTMKDIAQSEDIAFSNIKILFNNDQEISVAAIEETGRMTIFLLQRKGMRGAWFRLPETQTVKGCIVIAVQKPIKNPVHQGPQSNRDTCIVAIGTLETVTVVDAKKIAKRRDTKPILKFDRPHFQHDRATPTFSWGYGVSGASPNNATELLAISWGKAVILMSLVNIMGCDFDERSDITGLESNAETDIEMRQMKQVGFFCSESEIKCVRFLSDSLLAIVLNGNEVRVLSTAEFIPEQIETLLQDKKRHETIREFKAATQTSLKSQLEKEQEMAPLLYTQFSIINEKSAISTKRSTHFNQVSICNRKIAFLCEDKIMIGKIQSWKDYIHRLEQDKGVNWLNVLKAALDIYQGRLKGFAMLPEAREDRQMYMKTFMSDLLMKHIKATVDKQAQHQAQEPVLTRKTTNRRANRQSTGTQSTVAGSQFQIEEVAIKISIEFCLAIHEPEFLFKDVLSFFKAKGYESLFLAHLAAPIIGGEFLNDHVPSDLLMKLIKQEETRKEFDQIERIILNVNVKNYEQEFQKQLYIVIKRRWLPGAALHLMTSTQLKSSRQGCGEVLSVLLDNYKTLKFQDERAGAESKIVSIQEMRMLRNMNKQMRCQIEQSAYYVGYKLQWIIRLFLKGKKFPTGDLERKQYAMQVYSIIDFVTHEDHLATMLDFDCEAFFETVSRLFIGDPWKFVCNQGNFKFQFDKVKKEEGKEDIPARRMDDREVKVCQIPVANKILAIFKRAAENSTRAEPERSTAAFKQLLLSVVITQQQESEDGFFKGKFKRIYLEHKLAFDAIKSLFKPSQLKDRVEFFDDGSPQLRINPRLIIAAISAHKLEAQDIDEVIELAEKSKFKNDLCGVKIRLFELKKDFVRAFTEHLNHPDHTKYVFMWLNNTFEILHIEEKEWKRQQGFKFCDSVLEEEREESSCSDNDNEDCSDGSNKGELTVNPSQNDNDYGFGQAAVITIAKTQNLAKRASTFTKLRYEPIKKLIERVKDYMRKLVQQNSEQTVELIDNYLHEGNYHEELIKKQFRDYPKEQLIYLQKFFEKNEQTVLAAARHSESLEARTYQSYILLLIRLMCDEKNEKEPEEVEQWAMKPFCPIEPSLNICKQYKNGYGEAILLMRSGQPHEAIARYCEILDQQNILRLLEQIRLLNNRDEPQFLKPLVREEDREDEDMQAFLTSKESSFTTEALKHIARFDAIVGKACKICMLDELDIDDRQQCWFDVIKFLQLFKSQAVEKVEEVLKSVKQEVGSERYSSIQEKNKPQIVEKLSKFIQNRVNYILRFPGLNIPIKILFQEVQLSQQQLEMLTQEKMQFSSVNFQMERSQSYLMSCQRFDMFLSNANKISRGYMVEAQVRLQGRKAYPSTICSICMHSLTLRPNLKVFACGHTFHFMCLRGTEHCLLCYKTNYMAVRQEYEEASDLRLGKLAKNPNEDESEEEDLEERYRRDNDQWDEQGAKDEQAFKQKVITSQLERFDTILDDINLELSEFLEEMAT